jgi:hypothetical protein
MSVEQDMGDSWRIFTTNCFLFFRVLYKTLDANNHLVPLQITIERREKNNLIKYHLSGTTCDDIIEYYSTHAAPDVRLRTQFPTLNWQQQHCVFVSRTSTKKKRARQNAIYKLKTHFTP